LVDGEKEQRVLSFRRLRERALGVLGALQRRGLGQGDAMILCLGDNERFLEMFWACVFGGIVPVPLAPGTTDEHRRKLLRVFAQMGTASVYIDAPALERLEGFAIANGLAGEAARLRAAALAPGSLDVEAPGRPITLGPDDVAFIQFSSGSTGEPKGVVLTHRNLGANIAAIMKAAAFTDRDVALSWMPLSHDMGLIGFHLNMLACGASHAIMRTELFTRRPLLWLEQASQRGATVLCSPNFGYQHYLRQFAAKPPTGLDLSAVRLIFNGAEPISAALCRRFSQALAPHGLRAKTMFPVYGLAEASLAVSFPAPGAPLETVWLDRSALRTGQAVRRAAPASQEGVEFVKLGRPVPGCAVRIVDGLGALLADGVTGHVSISGENISVGYHQDASATERSRSPEGWFDTGDLGVLVDGQLVVTGRAKDLIIISGQNYHPADIERIAQEVAGIDANRVAAVGVPARVGATDGLAMFVVHRGSLEDFVVRAGALRRAIAQHAGLDVAYAVPVINLPKTTSGKLQRFALVEAFDRGEHDAALASLEALDPSRSTSDASEGMPLSTAARLVRICAPLIATQQITMDTDLLEINLNSLTLARIHEAVERDFPQKVEVTDFFDYPTLRQLADFIDARPH
ncbi:MAG: AMP-dependent synthetase, partial [Variovorax sp.]